MNEPWSRDAGELVRLLQTRELSARELVAAHLARIDEVDGRVNAVVARDDARVLAEATAVDDARARGEDVGPLAGLPMTIKDAFAVSGWPTTAGAPPFADLVTDHDAVAVARLRGAGVVVIGRTNVPAFAQDIQTFNDLHGTTENPWAHGRTSGGSSGGAAVALATGMSPVELGSDLAGSIRIPSAWCGVAGHKPTWGVVPNRGHVPPPPGTPAEPDVQTPGPMARRAADLEPLFDVLAGPDVPAARGWRLDLPPARSPRDAGFRAAVWLDDPVCPTSSAVREVLRGAVDRLTEAGLEVVEARPDIDVRAHRAMALRLLQAVTGAPLPPVARDHLARLAAEAGDEPTALEDAAAGLTQSHADWLRTDVRRRHHAAAFDRFLDDHAVLLTPVTPTTAIPHLHRSTFFDRTVEIDGEGRPYTDLAFWSLLAGAVHLPATVVPVGTARDGLPVGLQVIGARYADRTTLATARWIEAVLEPVTTPRDPA